MREPSRGVYSQNADLENSVDANAQQDCVEKYEISCFNSNFFFLNNMYIYRESERLSASGTFILHLINSFPGC